jgi:hypothetical protein
MMKTPQQLVEEASARIRKADEEAFNAAAAFTAGRFEEYLERRKEIILARMKALGDAAIESISETDAEAGDSGESG